MVLRGLGCKRLLDNYVKLITLTPMNRSKLVITAAVLLVSGVLAMLGLDWLKGSTGLTTRDFQFAILGGFVGWFLRADLDSIVHRSG